MVTVVVAGAAETVALAALKILDIFFIYLCHCHSQQTFIKYFFNHNNRLHAIQISMNVKIRTVAVNTNA